MSRVERQARRRERITERKNRTLKERIIKGILDFIKITLLIVIVLGIPLYIFFFQRDFLMSFESPEDIRDFFTAYQSQAVLAVLAGQILQVVIAILPGQAVEFASGFIFNLWQAFLIMLAGCIIGSTITYWVSRVLGADFINMYFGKGKVGRLLDKLETKRGYLTIFILYLLPGLPKDMLNYVAGIADIDFKPFIILSTCARIPALIITILLGNHSFYGNWSIVIGLLIGVAFLCVLGYIFRDKVFYFTDVIYERLRGERRKQKK